MSQTVSQGQVVVFHYTLSNSEGETLDSSAGDEPLPYLHGAGNIVPGLEDAMLGRSVGDKFEVVVPPEKGYGLRQGPGPQAMPREDLPEDLDPTPGMHIAAELPNGDMMPLFIVGVDEDVVWIDVDHPLAGQNLHFAIEIVSMRPATDAEVEHGHPHGLDGGDDHHH